MRSGAEVQALTRLALARLELTPPPNFFTVAIQQPGNSRVKDPLPKEKLAGVVYQIPCQCGKVYVGETQRRLETRVKEHRDACNKGDTGKSAIAEHQWDQQHQVNWEDTRVLDRASRPVQLRVKEALYIQKTPTNNRLNRDEGYELPGCRLLDRNREEVRGRGQLKPR